MPVFTGMSGVWVKLGGRPAVSRSSRSICTSTPYHVDFGAKAGGHVETFMQAIRWGNAERLLSQLRG